jgi:hypothetical protein
VLLATPKVEVKRLVEEAVVAKKLVVVAAVVVERVMLLKMLAPVKVFAPEKVLLSERRVEEADEPPQPTQEPTVRVPMLAAVAARFVEEAVVAKKLVVVAEVPVALRKVKFWRVLEPVRRRFESVVNPPVAVRVPVKLAVDEIVWPLIKPEVMAPRVEFPAVKVVVKRLVDEAVVAKELVVVAAVPVAFGKVRP